LIIKVFPLNCENEDLINQEMFDFISRQLKKNLGVRQGRTATGAEDYLALWKEITGRGNLMKVWIFLLKAFGIVWLVLAVPFILIAYFWVWKEQGFLKVLDLLSPFNFWNMGLTMVTLAPGVAALILAKKLRNKAQSQKRAD